MSARVRVIRFVLAGATALGLAIGINAAFGAAPAGAATAAPTQPTSGQTGAAPTTVVPAAPPTTLSLTIPSIPTPTPATPGNPGSVTVNLGGAVNQPSESLTIIVGLTLLSVAPALLMMMTAFPRIVIVLSLTRNAMGLQTVPPNQVVVGLALFLSLFIMSPTLSAMNKDAVQPYLHKKMSASQGFTAGEKPLHEFMIKQTRTSELALFENQPGQKKPKTPADVPMTTLIPAFILSEIKTAFIIGFIVFIPFLVIDLIVSSTLMSMGMMMLPPVLVSLPFKILLFVLVDGWGLVVTSLLTSFH